MDAAPMLVGVVIGALLAYLLLRGTRRGQEQVLRDDIAAGYEAQAEAERARIVQTYEARLHRLEAQQEHALRQARRESTRRSRSVLKGRMAEQMVPLLPGFAYWPADARFLGDPIDYVVFCGYSECKDGGNGEALEVVLLDIKHGKSTLTPGQRHIARAIAAGRVRFEVVRVFPDGAVNIESF